MLVQVYVKLQEEMVEQGGRRDTKPETDCFK